ncbi:MAG: hypothetical protein QOK42_85 [Frankiaceae bacterium]|nr:hypothetical protein [Frankiaceae bacterium]MDX6273629.1 hypothetical protein [Frankiales bacterium]
MNPLPFLPVVFVGAGTALKELAMVASPQGFQGRARRNAWLAMADDDVRAQDREEAARAMRLALARPMLGRAAGA